jgi:hypothetical protein
MFSISCGVTMVISTWGHILYPLWALSGSWFSFSCSHLKHGNSCFFSEHIQEMQSLQCGLSINRVTVSITGSTTVSKTLVFILGSRNWVMKKLGVRVKFLVFLCTKINLPLLYFRSNYFNYFLIFMAILNID